MNPCLDLEVQVALDVAEHCAERHRSDSAERHRKCLYSLCPKSGNGPAARRPGTFRCAGPKRLRQSAQRRSAAALNVLDSGLLHRWEAVLRGGVLPPWPSLIDTR